MKKRFYEARNLVFENKMFSGLTLNEALKLQATLKINKFCMRDVIGNLDLGYIRGQERKNKAL